MVRASHKGHMYDSFTHSMSRITKSIVTESRLVWVLRAGRKSEWATGSDCYEYEVSFQLVKNVLTLDCGDGCVTLWIY